MSDTSLTKSIRTYSVDVGQANRIQSNRFLNPSAMVCVPWNGLNLKGQAVCADSQYTKTPGCNSALDRISVENMARPKYSNYVSLDAHGIDGQGQQAMMAAQQARQSGMNGPHYSNQFGADVQYSRQTVDANGRISYDRYMANMK